MRNLAISLGLALATGVSVHAQDAPKPVEMNLPYMDVSKLNPDDLAAAKRSGETMARDILNSYETLKTPEMAQDVQQTKRRYDDIADPVLAGERKKILEFLGFDPEAETGLYYFVSWSMPLELLRSYVIEAMWSGGTLVFKGVPPGKELGKFIVQDLRQLVYGKGAAVSVSIDPRLFDAFAIRTVPAIVFTTVKSDMQCQGINPVAVKVGEVQGSYDTCPELDPATYWKMTGSITTSYALSSFIESGAEKAKPYQASLAKGLLNGTQPKKEQQPFAGKWEDAISPSELMAAQEAAGLMTTPAKTQ